MKVDVPKGALRFREFIDNKCVGFNQFTFIHCCHMVIVVNEYLAHPFQGIEALKRHFEKFLAPCLIVQGVCLSLRKK